MMAVLILINLYTFFLYGYDKYRAIHNKWRIPEAVLLSSSLFLGALGALLGMFVFRHKTRHKLFVWFVPICLIIQTLIIIFIIE